MGRRFERPSFDISKILEHYGADLHRVSGTGWRKMKCPFHPDSRASATVNLELNRFSCHAGCLDRQSEDGIGLVMHVEKLTFQESVEQASRITGEEHGTIRDTRRQSSSLFGEPWD